jgi:hypothetical protein
MIPTKDVVTVEQAGTLDDWGRPTNPTSKQFNCRIDYRSEEVKLDNGVVVLSKAIILIKGVALVSINDTLKWSDQYGEHEAKPLSVSPLKDLSSKVLFTKVVV